MHWTIACCGLSVLLVACHALRLWGQSKDELADFRAAGLKGGIPARGKVVFESDAAACRKCHDLKASERLAGPGLSGIGDKYGRDQLIQAVLEPSVTIHPDFGTITASTKDGKVHAGVLRKRGNDELQLIDAEGRLVRLPVAEIEQEQRTGTSLMPAGIQKLLTPGQFADLIAYLESLKSADGGSQFPGMPDEIPAIAKPIRLVPMSDVRFDHPVWIIGVPGNRGTYLVVEQKSRKIWRLEGSSKELFVDLSQEASTGEFEGVVCLAFHPRFPENHKYYVNYHVRNQGSFFSPVIVERQATPDLRRDAGVPSRRLLQVHQDTDIHWGGMIAFGPDGYLYIGAGDAGPQEDPEGHGQNLSQLAGSILRIDVDRQGNGKPYAIPESNPYRHSVPPIRREIWASGLRMPWRFSFDPATGDLWVGDVGQNIFEEVSIVRAGENHGWNVYEGFMPFSDRYRRTGETYTPPVMAYRRKYGCSVTGGYVYRGKRNLSYNGAYIFGDFESKRIWAMTQADRRLVKVRQIGASPERIASFGVDADGELFLAGYEGTIFRLVLDDSDFEAKTTHVRLLRDGAKTAARVAILGGDGKPFKPSSAVVRESTRGESYFYAEDAFDVELPPGSAKLTASGGLETIPQTVTVDQAAPAELTVPLRSWIDMAARGWYSGDSHVHLHTGGPIQVKAADAGIAARAEGVHYVNLCASNNLGDDIREADQITGKPDAASTDRNLLVFGEEMRSTIYGHMQFFGIRSLVSPQYTGFDATPHREDYPANHAMATEATGQGAVVTYGHPLFAGQPFPFDKDPSKPSGAARELPIDAVLGVVHAVDLMSYNSDEGLSAELWYRLLNCGLKLSACVGTDALLDRSTDPLGGDRIYVKTNGPLTIQSWLDGLKAGRTFVTNGPIPTLEVDGEGPGETVELPGSGKVRVLATAESHVPFERIEVIVNGKLVAQQVFAADNTARRYDVEVPIERSSWVALRVRGPAHPAAFDGCAWAHTSPVYVEVGGREIANPQDAAYFVDWIEQMIKSVGARDRFARAEDRRQVEALFRGAQKKFRRMADAG